MSYASTARTFRPYAAVHGAPLGAEALAAMRDRLGWRHEPFEVPDEVYRYWRERVAQRTHAHLAWRERVRKYREAHPDLARAR